VTLRPRRNHCDLDAHLVGKELQIIFGLLRELGEVLKTERRLLPTRQQTIVNLHVIKPSNVRWKVGKSLALVLVFQAHRNVGKAIEDVEFGDDEGVEMVYAGAIAGRRHIKPTAATRTPGDRAILSSALSNLFTLGTLGLGWKRAAPHARGIGF